MFDLGLTLLASAERSPDRLAVVDRNTKFTYQEWFDVVARTAGLLDALGLKPGAHVIGILQNRWEAAALHWACQMLGLIITPINWRATPDDLEYFVSNAEAQALFFESVSSAAVEKATNLPQIPRVGMDVPGVELSFSELLQAAKPVSTPRAKAEDVSVMLYTSGTTGRPKGVPRRHYQERAAAVAHVAQNTYRTGERTLGVMPLYHTMGVRSMVSMALVDGLLVCQPSFNADEAVQAIRKWELTNLYLVPTLYHDLINCSAFSHEAVSSVRKIGYAGATMPEGLVQEVQEAFRPDLFVNHYGSSEVYTYTINDDAYGKPRSAGRAGLNQRIRVMRLDATSPHDLAAVGEEGQIIADLRSSEAFEGYWKRPEATQKAIRDGWFLTGDAGYQDEGGEFYITGRVDDIIITGGENVSPIEIENTLSTHPGVDDVAVVGFPDKRWGQKVVALVHRNGSVDAKNLDDHCLQSSLARFKRPREYIFVQAIPKSPTGKILRRKILAGEYEVE